VQVVASDRKRGWVFQEPTVLPARYKAARTLH
jgi:hypothetical protein